MRIHHLPFAKTNTNVRIRIYRVKIHSLIGIRLNEQQPKNVNALNTCFVVNCGMSMSCIETLYGLFSSSPFHLVTYFSVTKIFLLRDATGASNGSDYRHSLLAKEIFQLIESKHIKIDGVVSVLRNISEDSI